MSFPWVHVYLSGPCMLFFFNYIKLLSLSASSWQFSQFCSLLPFFFSFLIPTLTFSLCQYHLVFFPPAYITWLFKYLISPISTKLSEYLHVQRSPLFFFKTNCFSCHGSSSSQQFSFHPILLSPLLSSIIMAQCSYTDKDNNIIVIYYSKVKK